MSRIKVVGTVLVATMLALTIACSRDPEVVKRKYVQSGDDYVARQKYAEAIIQYRNAIAVDPKFGEARLKLDAQLKTAELLQLGQRFEDARDRADRALRIDPKNVHALILKGNALAGLKDLDGAITQIEDAIKTDPSQ